MDDQISLPNKIINGLKDLIEKLGVRNFSIIPTRGSAKGDNYLGIITRVEVIGENEHGESTKLNLLMKIAPEAEEFRKYINIKPIYEREVHMYESVLPIFLEFQLEIKLETPFYPFVKYFGSSLTPPYEYLIMEDMQSRDYKMKNRKSEIDLKHCLLVMKPMVNIMLWFLKEKRPQLYQKLLQNTKEIYFSTVNLKALCETIRSPCEKVIKHLNEVEDKELIEKVQEFVRFPVEGLLENLSAEAAGNHAVFCHGDCWSNNILFKYKDCTPIDLCILDWQLARCASPAVDLAYFIFACTEKKLRDAHYDELLEAYHSSLQSFLEEMGCNPDLITKNILIEHMRNFSKYGLMMSLIVIPLVTAENEELPDWTSEMTSADRKKMFTEERKNEESSIRRLIDIVRDFDKFGYFISPNKNI
ncbi:hypothetical protein JTB14_004450 [Gonioctena quinquepunctata]|nr:hypothetical protein JTB14_004450 [Gonioctena quinquepunctata]